MRKFLKKIKINNCEWEHDGIDYKRGKDGEYLFNVFLETTPHDLNMEVEILEEEKKIPEKITINDNGTIGFPNGQWTARNMDKAFAMKINKIIDYLKSKGDE